MFMEHGEGKMISGAYFVSPPANIAGTQIFLIYQERLDHYIDNQDCK